MNDGADLRKERKNIAELEDLTALAAKASSQALAPVIDSWLNTVREASLEELESATIPEEETDQLQEEAYRLVASSFMLGLIHAQEEEPGTNLADDIIPPIAYKEAINFLSAKIPLTKKQWKDLEPKIRFRAFTVALLGKAHEIEAAKQILIKSLEEGTSYSDTWYKLKDTVKNGEAISPAYWENVYRTNTQSAYVAGKLEQYQGSGVVAYQLMVIEDSRTTPICKNLLSKASGYGAIIPVNDKFWSQHGFPPYHYQCRTSIRGIWKSQMKTNKIDTDKTAPDLKTFEPMEDFGGNPAQDGIWWKETDNQKKQAEKWGLQDTILGVQLLLGLDEE